jgi:Uma2 family endonuclease
MKEDCMPAPARTLSGDMLINEFLGFLKHRPKEEYWQLVEGVAVMMNPPTMAHQVIALNLRDLLKEALRVQELDVLVINEIGVRVTGVTDFLPRPDLVVVPGIASYQVYADRFLLVAEVLSPSNTKSFIAQKVRRYKQHPDNLYCLVIDSRRAWLQMHARRTDWEPITLNNPASTLEMPEFGLRCSLGDLYRHTPLDPAQSAGGRRLRSR